MGSFGTGYDDGPVSLSVLPAVPRRVDALLEVALGNMIIDCAAQQIGDALGPGCVEITHVDPDTGPRIMIEYIAMAGQFLKHNVTGERVRLPEGCEERLNWELAFSPEGWGYVYSGTLVIWCSHVLSRSL